MLCVDLLNNYSFIIATLFLLGGNPKLYLLFKTSPEGAYPISGKDPKGTSIFQIVFSLTSRFHLSNTKSNFKKLELNNRASLIGFNKRPNVNLFNNKSLSTDKLNFLSKFASGLTLSKKNYRPNTIALEHIYSGNPTTSEVVNSVLFNQNVYITQKELDNLLSLPKVNFDLPITNQTYPALLGLIGKPGSKRSKAGIYIFSHKYSDKKYVGSSYDLARRFNQYFEKNALFSNKNIGILLPIIEKESLKAFTLEVTVIPSSFSKNSHCFLEQYLLLDKKFNLNSHKIVNFRANQGFKIYLYDKDCKTLYYSSISLNAFCADLGIHHTSYKKHVNKNELYLDHFLITNNLISDAVPTDLTELQVREFIKKQRINSLDKLHKSYGRLVEVFDTDTNTTAIIDSVSKAASKFGVSRTSVRNYISSRKPYKNRYIFKFVNQ